MSCASSGVAFSCSDTVVVTLSDTLTLSEKAKKKYLLDILWHILAEKLLRKDKTSFREHSGGAEHEREKRERDQCLQQL